MKIVEMIGLSALGVSIVASYNVYKKRNETTEILSAKLQVDDIVYVTNALGTDLYKGVDVSKLPGYSYGRDRIVNVPNKTYLGRATGRVSYQMVEVKAVIGSQDINFWVKGSHVGVVAANDETAKAAMVEKTEAVKTKLMNI